VPAKRIIRMMKVNNRNIKLMLLIATVAAVAMGIFRAFLLVNCIEPETGFYITETNMDTVFTVLIIAMVVLIGFFGFLARKNPAPEHLDSKSTFVVFSSALCAFMYISVFLYGIYSIMGSAGNRNYFLVAEVILCIPCCLNHISVCSSEIREKNTPHALFAMSEAVFFALRVVETFMDKNSQINVSQRSLELVMLCSVMVFFLLESAFLVKREQEEKESLSKYFMSAIATVVFPIVAVMPYLAVSLFWCFDAEFVIMDVLECCIMLFAASRLLTLKTE